MTLSQSLQKLGDQQLVNQVNLMLAAQYGQATKDWNGEALKQALRPYLKGATAKSGTSKQTLKPLYPSP